MICDAVSDDGVDMKIDNIIAVVDAARMLEEFENGRALERKDLEEDDLENLLIQQIEFCTTMVLNKTDLVSKRQLKELEALVRTLQSDAKIIETDHGNIDIKDALETDSFDLDRAMSSAGWVEAIQHPEEHEEGEAYEYGIDTFVYYRRRPFVHDKLVDLCDKWPHSIIRCKGMVWYEEEPDMSFIFEQAGRQILESPSGRFLASAPKAQQENVLKRYPQVKKMWDAKYGDRMIKLVFIGKDMDQKAIEASLDECLGE